MKRALRILRRFGGPLGRLVDPINEILPFLGPHKLSDPIPEGWQTCCSISSNREMYRLDVASGCADICGYIWQVPSGVVTPDTLLWPGTKYNYISFGPAAFGGIRYDVHSAYWIPSTWQFPTRYMPALQQRSHTESEIALDPNLIPIPGIHPLPRPMQLPRPKPGYKPVGDPAPFELVTPLEPTAPNTPTLPPYKVPGNTVIITPGRGQTDSPNIRPLPNSGHSRVPPTWREHERKKRYPVPVVNAVASAITESTDVIDALYEALPWQVRRFRGRDGKWRDSDITPQDRIKRLYDNLDKLDVDDAVINLLFNIGEDKLIGSVSQLGAQIHRDTRYNRPVGIGTGPAL